jgi:hypothetical protein
MNHRRDDFGMKQFRLPEALLMALPHHSFDQGKVTGDFTLGNKT